MSEEPLSPKTDKNHWAKLAESLGITPSTEPKDSSGEAVLQQPDATAMIEKDVPSGEATSRLSDNQTTSQTPASVPASIPLRRGLASESRSASNWDEIARQLGLAPTNTPTAPTTDVLESTPPAAPSEMESGVASAPAVAEPTSPQTAIGDTGPVLSPLEQTIEPPVFEEAMSVTVAGPDEPSPIVQEEVTPSGDWLEEQVVAPVEASGASTETWPLTQDILDIKDSKQAVATDTLFLPEATSPMLSDERGEAAGSQVAEKKSRKRHRRKKKSRGTATVNPEPFEEELPEIVELATVADDNGALPAPRGSDEASQERERELSQASEGQRKKGHRATADTTQATDEADDVIQGGEDGDLVRPAHKAIPGWSEVVGYVIQKNMEARSRRPNHRDRRR